ncbi:cytochrome o ubiquinol oxidase subunit IV [Acerihabitans arboris]|uniref:Cytochrome bo(3) ubiquinol oxidase subunit 4 n=1 Tax=Acerihabitans arboris TaxID=2691583 RepID=A0A845SQW6_9GAMM|nr:cytochrome o ubiquinol oxidase subunit IV [Acerihabitans arboris]NDL64998.1 cytochrome o ubiquinol oxidase subunit IV [Acerihabitans arboris]
MSSHATTGHGGASHGSLKSYLIGFVLSIILTVIPFVMVMNDSATKTTLIVVLALCAVVQIMVHLVYFLHLDRSSEQRWNVVALAFAVLIIAILVVGSLWVMLHLNYNLMSH